ncbi:membrane protein [Streptococcus pneumoniae]|nr:membrane protein [Streptococcus pneumoniae]
MPVRKLQSYEVDYQEELHQQVPRYQDYTPEAQSDTNLKEILFFVNIAIFCICIAIFSFIFLALKFSTALAFVAAIGSSLLVLKIQRSIIKRKRRR